MTNENTQISKSFIVYTGLNELVLEELTSNKEPRILILNKVITTSNKNNFHLADILINAHNYNLLVIIVLQHNIALQSCIVDKLNYVFITNGSDNININRLYDVYAKEFQSKKLFVAAFNKYVKNNDIIVIEKNNKQNIWYF